MPSCFSLMASREYHRPNAPSLSFYIGTFQSNFTIRTDGHLSSNFGLNISGARRCTFKAILVTENFCHKVTPTPPRLFRSLLQNIVCTSTIKSYATRTLKVDKHATTKAKARRTRIIIQRLLTRVRGGVSVLYPDKKITPNLPSLERQKIREASEMVTVVRINLPISNRSGTLSSASINEYSSF